MARTTFTHEDVQEHVIDFLYGKIDGQVRAAFEAHVGTCDACRLEVAALQQTQRAARSVIRAGLEEPMPASVHRRIMEAAEKAIPPAAIRRDNKRPSFWRSLLHARWTVPTFTAVAAVAGLVLVRETIFREARRPIDDSSVASAERRTPTRTSDSPSAEAPPAREEAPPPAREEVPPATTERRFAPQTSPRRAGGVPKTHPRRKVSATPSAASGAAVASGRVEPLRGESAADDAEGGIARAAPMASAPRSDWPERPVPPRDVSPADRRGVAAAVAKSSQSANDEIAASDGAESVRGATATAEAARAPVRPAPSPSSALGDSVPTPRSAGANLPRAARVAQPAAPPPPSAVVEEHESVERMVGRLNDHAEKLMATGRWREAVAAYSDLLRRFPEHRLRTTWRGRRGAAQARVADERPHVDPPPRE